MISPPRQHSSCSPKVISTSAAILNLFHRAHMPWILEQPCDSRLWDVPKIQTLAAQRRTAWALADFCVFGLACRQRTLFLVGNVDSRDLPRIAAKCAGRGGSCSVSGQNMFIQRLPHHAQSFALRVNTPALPVYLSRWPDERTSIPEKTRIVTQHVKGFWYGS